MWLHQDMDLIRHYDVGVQIVKAKLSLSKSESVNQALRDARVIQPNRPNERSVQFCIFREKCFHCFLRRPQRAQMYR